jgi:hypothetical protein
MRCAYTPARLIEARNSTPDIFSESFFVVPDAGVADMQRNRKL